MPVTTDPNLVRRPVFGDAVGATTVTTVYARAHAAGRPGVPGDWRDEQAERVWAALVEIGEDEGVDPRSLVLDDDMDLVGTVLRSRAIDDRVAAFVAAHPGACVVSLGIGLCNRASRLAHLDADWVGIDRTSVLELRSRLIPDDAVSTFGASVTEIEWLTPIDPRRPTIFVAEGLLMYLDSEAVATLLTSIGAHMQAETTFVADVFTSPVHRMPHPIKKVAGVEYHFGAPRKGGLASVANGWQQVGEVDGMAPIAPAAARAAGALMLVFGHAPYAVVTLRSCPNRT